MNFAGHSVVGLLVGSLAALAVATVAPSTLGLPLLVPAMVLVLVYVGAVYPDVDLPDSIPRRRIRPYVRAVAVGGVTLVATQQWDWFVDAGSVMMGILGVSAEPPLTGGIALAAGALGAVVIIDPLFGALTGTHRTRTHSLALHTFIASLLAIGIWSLVSDRPVIVLLPFAFVLGVAAHRIADDAI
ncbi:MAG: metal-dependent hydrolase [Salinirussus sp.]